MKKIEDKVSIAIVGRSNVGKSTLFNRLIEKPKAITFPEVGTTRDRNYGRANWQGHEFIFVDTGGLEDSEEIDREIKKQVDIAIKKANLIIFLVDLKDGVLPQDIKISKILKKINKPTLLVGNKADTFSMRMVTEEKEWLKLTFGKPMAVSAASGSGTGDLLDEIFNILKNNDCLKPMATEDEEKPISVAIIGKPNVGKSTLLNSLIGEERVLVSDKPFTTREPQDILLEYKENSFLLVDTVGMRKKAKVGRGLEKIGVKRSITTIKKADVVLFVIDISKPMASQDKHLSQIVLENNAGLIIIANKWDLIEDKDTKTMDEYNTYCHRFFPYLNWAPVAFTSAKTGEKVHKILDLILSIKEERNKEISQDDLDNFLRKTLSKHKNIIHRKKKMTSRPKIVGLEQKDVSPPRFNLLTTSKIRLPEGLVKFIEKRLREEFTFLGTPIIMEVEQTRGRKPSK